MEEKWQRIDINKMFSNYQKRFRRESLKEKERREKREMLNKITFQHKQIEVSAMVVHVSSFSFLLIEQLAHDNLLFYISFASYHPYYKSKWQI